MTTKRIALTLTFLLSIAILAMPALAAPGPCETVCVTNTFLPVWTACSCGYEVTTCGEWIFELGCQDIGLTSDFEPSEIGLPNTVLMNLAIRPYGH